MKKSQSFVSVKSRTVVVCCVLCWFFFAKTFAIVLFISGCTYSSSTCVYSHNIYCKQKRYSENIEKYYFTENARNLQKCPTKTSKTSDENVQNDQDIRNVQEKRPNNLYLGL